MQLERILRSQGFGSRPECRALIYSGRVSIGATVCEDPYADYDLAGFQFSVDDATWDYCEFIYLVLNKPKDHECSHKPIHHPSIYTLLPRHFVNRGVQAVGRLDEDTTGLLLMTDDGQFIHRYTSPKKLVEKIYAVTTKHRVDDVQVNALLDGVMLKDESIPIKTVACERIGDRLLHVSVTEGKYHMVKRMIGAAGNRVEALHRIAVGGFELPPTLASGEWVLLGSNDLEVLSSNSKLAGA